MATSYGSGLRQGFERIGEVTLFGLRALATMLRPSIDAFETFRQLYKFGWLSLPLVAPAGFAVGAVISMHTRSTLERFGAEETIPEVIGLALMREIGPLVTGLLFCGRVGAGIGAELGAMRTTEQIDALESLAVDSFRYLVVTRIAACILALPILTVIMNSCGILGGYLAETLISGMSLPVYVTRAFSVVEFADYVPATLKTTVFGFLVGTVACYLGYYAKGGTEGVGAASTHSVVFSSVVVILANVLMVKSIFFVFPEAR
jgi:phospholipid/cholesterol/gamma-HCH transport system permease protein